MIAYNVAKSILRNKLELFNDPSFITFFVTWTCNTQCSFCDVWSERRHDKEIMTPAEIEAIFKQFKHIDVLRITGGEPFVRNDIPEIVNRINRVQPSGIIHITTNGILSDRIIAAMQSIIPLEKVHIKISIDAVGKRHDELRGVKGAYEKALRTVIELTKLRQKKKFYIGVNQAIVNEEDVESYVELKKILKEYDVALYPSIAFDSTNSLYSNKDGEVDPDLSFKPFGNFTKEGLKKTIQMMVEDGKAINNFQEQMIDKYHMKGIYNRMVENKMSPRPRCVALNNHLRILPNGDVPVCLYNGKIVANLKRDNFKDLWFGDRLKEDRKWVRKCSGCWQSCESSVSAIYTGDIWKGLV